MFNQANMHEHIFISGSIDRIYSAYSQRMKRFAKIYVGTDEDAENLVQDVFMTLWEKRDELRVRNLDSYLFSLVRNKCLDFLRHKVAVENFKQEIVLKTEALEYLNTNIDEDINLEEVIHNAIDRLPERCRAIFCKSRFEGKKYSEIASELGLSVNTVEVQMGIALKRLKKELKAAFQFIFIF
jgi:RNA polymerase sigma-70 factor (ECF subfamily)